MEGGTDHDLRILDMPSEEDEDREKSASGGAEPPKREDLKSVDGDCKPSIEKTKNEKVCFVLCRVLPSNKHFIVLLMIVNVVQEENKSANTERAAAAEGDDVKEEAEKEVAKEQMPETKKVSVTSIT